MARPPAPVGRDPEALADGAAGLAVVLRERPGAHPVVREEVDQELLELDECVSRGPGGRALPWWWWWVGGIRWYYL